MATEPLRAMVVGAFVCGLSMRDVESLCAEAGLGQVLKSSASRICRELRDRFRAFAARDLSEVRLVTLFLDAIYLPVRPAGAKEGVLVAWGVAESGERPVGGDARDARVGGGLARTRARPRRRGLPAPPLVVSDGAPGLVSAIEQLWPGADRQRCTVHRLHNVLAKLPKREREPGSPTGGRSMRRVTSPMGAGGSER